MLKSFILFDFINLILGIFRKIIILNKKETCIMLLMAVLFKTEKQKSLPHYVSQTFRSNIGEQLNDSV